MPTQPYKNAAGKRVPSVTTILKEWGDGAEGLLHWAWQVGADGMDLNEARVKVASAGTVAHGLAEKHIKNQPIPTLGELTERHGPELAKAAWAAYGAYLDWRDMTRIKVVASEIPLVSEQHQVGGTADGIGVEDKDQAIALIDFKSSKRLYAKAVPQVSAYARMWTEKHPDMPVTKRYVLRWGPDGEFGYHSIPQTWDDAGWEIFKACLIIAKAKKAIRV